MVESNIRIAAVTMSWNENLFLPMWIRHYGRHLGYENLYIIDNDSDPELLQMPAGVSVVRYPRGPFDDKARAVFVSQFVNLVRMSYDAVIFTDCDEFLVPDPRLYKTIAQYVEDTPGECLGSIGLNVHHILTEENPYNSSVSLFSQRKFVQFVAPMCKPAITRSKVNYSPGFHHCDLKPSFGRIYNFHMRWIDCCYALQRLALTRSMAWKDPSGWHYQRQSDEDTFNQFVYVKSLERRSDPDFTFSDRMISISTNCEFDEKSSFYRIPQDIRDTFLTEIPTEFVDTII